MILPSGADRDCMRVDSVLHSLSNPLVPPVAAGRQSCFPTEVATAAADLVNELDWQRNHALRADLGER